MPILVLHCILGSTTTNRLATCGGNRVCIIDCESGQVLSHFKEVGKVNAIFLLVIYIVFSSLA